MGAAEVAEEAHVKYLIRDIRHAGSEVEHRRLELQALESETGLTASP